MQIAVLVLGAMFAVAGIVLFAKRGITGQNTIKIAGAEFQLAGSSLVVFVVGCALIVVAARLQPSEKPSIFPPPQVSPAETDTKARLTTEISNRIGQALDQLDSDQEDVSHGKLYPSVAIYQNVIAHLDNSYAGFDFSTYPEYKSERFRLLVAELTQRAPATEQLQLKNAQEGFEQLEKLALTSDTTTPVPTQKSLAAVHTSVAIIKSKLIGNYLKLAFGPDLTQRFASPAGNNSLDNSTPVFLKIKNVKLFASEPESEVQVHAFINDSDFRYPSVAGVSWLKVGPGMSPGIFELPNTDRYDVRFEILLKDSNGERKLASQLVIPISASSIPVTKDYSVHPVSGMTRGASIGATLSFEITRNP
jgi:hypothetical protein